VAKKLFSFADLKRLGPRILELERRAGNYGKWTAKFGKILDKFIKGEPVTSLETAHLSRFIQSKIKIYSMSAVLDVPSPGSGVTISNAATGELPVPPVLQDAGLDVDAPLWGADVDADERRRDLRRLREIRDNSDDPSASIQAIKLILATTEAMKHDETFEELVSRKGNLVQERNRIEAEVKKLEKHIIDRGGSVAPPERSKYAVVIAGHGDSQGGREAGDGKAPEAAAGSGDDVQPDPGEALPAASGAGGLRGVAGGGNGNGETPAPDSAGSAQGPRENDVIQPGEPDPHDRDGARDGAPADNPAGGEPADVGNVLPGVEGRV
jgi:hypothetical protein